MVHKAEVIRLEHKLIRGFFALSALTVVACFILHIIRLCRTRSVVVTTKEGGPAIAAAKAALQRSGIVDHTPRRTPPRQRELTNPFSAGGAFSTYTKPDMWLQTDGGVKVAVPIVAESPSFRNGPMAHGSKVINDIAGRMMGMVSSSHRLRNGLRGLQSWENPGRRPNSVGQLTGFTTLASSPSRAPRSQSPTRQLLMDV